MAKGRFVVNVYTRVVHRVPTTERCNVDQIPKGQRLYLPTMPSLTGRRHLRRCGHCFAGDR